MVPPSKTQNTPPDNSPDWELVDAHEPAWPIVGPAKMKRSTRVGLVVMVLGLTAIFVTAAWITPYDEWGAPRSMATHTQLGLPDCNMVMMTGKPCPACGMTTSFALLVHGDVLNSLRANWVGTLLALFWMALIPWGAASAIRGRILGIRNLELVATVAVGITLACMVLRWGWIMMGK